MTRRTNAAAGPSLSPVDSRAFSARVRALMAERHLAQADLGAALGLGQPAVSLLLAGAGRWREADAEKASAFLGATLAGLLGGGEAGACPDGPALLGLRDGRAAAAGTVRLRKEAGLTRGELASRLGEAPGWLEAREQGGRRMTGHDVSRCARALGTDPSALLAAGRTALGAGTAAGGAP